MPNNGRITLCPYYRDEKNLSISCEDTFRRFRWPAQKEKWLDTYCDDMWLSCPYARDMNDLYERMEGSMNKRNLELEHRCQAMEKEQRKLASLLGKAEKRESQKAEKIRTLEHEKRALETVLLRTKAELKKARDKEETILQDFNDMGELYKTRLAYLMSEYAGGKLDEIALDEWAKQHEYKIVADAIGEDITGKPVTVSWKAITRRIENDQKRSDKNTDDNGHMRQ